LPLHFTCLFIDPYVHFNVQGNGLRAWLTGNLPLFGGADRMIDRLSSCTSVSSG